MARLFVLLFAIIFAAQILTGCGQRGEQKVPVNKPEGPAAESTEEQDTEEDMESEEVLPSESAPKTVTESDIDKATIQESQTHFFATVNPEPVPKPSTVGQYVATVEKREDAPKITEEIVVANFDSGEKPNNIGGNFGAWNKDPSDPTQWCRENFDNVSRHGDSGFSMKLDYSVDSPNPAYNGFWMMLPNFDASKYDVLNLWVKGDRNAGYTTVFKIELKNAAKQIGRYYITNVSDQWQEVSIPLSEFKGLIDRTSLTEFVVVFEDRMASNKKGVIYIDGIRFIKK